MQDNSQLLGQGVVNTANNLTAIDGCGHCGGTHGGGLSWGPLPILFSTSRDPPRNLDHLMTDCSMAKFMQTKNRIVPESCLRVLRILNPVVL